MNEKVLVIATEAGLAENHIQQLHEIYTDDTVRYLREDTFVDHYSQYVINRLDPKRMTFVGDADKEHFGDPSQAKFTGKQLADYLIDTCRLPKSVEVIDFIGLQTGFIEKGESFVREFAKQLASRGYSHVEVKAFTNLSAPHLGETLVSVDTVARKYEIRAYKNTAVNQKKAAEINTSLEKIDQEIEQKKHELHSLTCKVELAKEKNPVVHAKKGQDQTAVFERKISNLRSELSELLEQRDKLIESKKILYSELELLSTHDPRKTLDREVGFYFNGRVIQQIDDFEQKIATKHKAGVKHDDPELIELKKNLQFLHKKIEFIVRINAHISDIEDSLKGFTLFTNATHKLDQLKGLKELKEALIEGTDLDECIKLINERLKSDELAKSAVKPFLREILQNLILEMNQIRESPEEKRNINIIPG